MDMKWVIDEACSAYYNGLPAKDAVTRILNGIALDESVTISDYTFAKEAICKMCCEAGEDKLEKILVDMVDRIIADEMSHNASCVQAVSIMMGQGNVKPGEYDKAIKSEGIE